jgi:hypothetical protein
MPKWYGESSLNPDLLIPKSEQWLDQWHRLCRWYKRILSLRSKAMKTSLTIDDADLIVAYFMNCYHLRDWLLESRPEWKPDIEQLISSSFEYKACRDICNGYKHKLIRNPSLDSDFNFYREYDYDAIPGHNPEIYRFAFADGNSIRKYDVFNLSDLCQELWDNFLKSKLHTV